MIVLMLYQVFLTACHYKPNGDDCSCASKSVVYKVYVCKRIAFLLFKTF